MFDFTNFLKSVFPRGAIWVPRESSDFDNMVSAIAESADTVYSYLGKLGRIREPQETDLLTDLEKEYGIIPNTKLTEQERRDALEAIAFAARGDGSQDFLQSQLRRAGFPDAFVYQNDPAVDPHIYTEDDFACVCGGTNAVCGNDLAYCGWLEGAGGFVIVNGDLTVSSLPDYLAQCGGDNTFAGNSQAIAGYYITETVTYGGYELPTTSELWHLIFFVGGEKEGLIYGAIDFDDANMEALGVTDWTAGNGAVLTKDTSVKSTGLQSLKIATGSNYTQQEIGLNDPQTTLEFSAVVASSVTGVVFDASENKNAAVTYGSPTDLAGYIGTRLNDTATNDAIGGIDSVASTGTLGFWLQVNDYDWGDYFNAPFNASGSSELEDEYTINSATQSAETRLIGNDATVLTWAAEIGDNLAISSSGPAPTVDFPAPGIGDTAAKINAGQAYLSPDGTNADLNTLDFVIEALCTGHPTTGTGEILGRKNAGVGFSLQDVSGTLTFTVTDSGGSVSLSSAGAMTPGVFSHVIIFGDRSDASTSGCQMFINGTQVAGADISAISGTVTPATDYFSVGMTAGAASKLDGVVSFVQMAKRASWFAGGATNDTDFQAMASERFAKACGVYPATADGSPLPTTQTRSTLAYLDKWDATNTERILVPVEADWTRVCRRKDANGDYLAGVCLEAAETNNVPYSENFNWPTQTNCTVIPDNEDDPTKYFIADSIVPDLGATSCRINRSISLSGTVQVTMSVWAKAGYVDWLRIYDSYQASAVCNFDLTNGVVGTPGSGIDVAGIEDWGNGWFRCWINYENSSGTYSQFRIYPAEADGGATITAGDGSTPAIHLFGAQLEFDRAEITPSTYIKTEASAVTRTVDLLQYEANDNIGGHSLARGNARCKILLPDATVDPAVANSVFNINDGGASSDQIVGRVKGQACAASMTATAGSAGIVTGSTDVRDNTIHSYSQGWQDDNFVLAADTTLEGSDTTCDAPANLDQLEIGANVSGLNQTEGLISEFAISAYGWGTPRPVLEDDVHALVVGVIQDTLTNDYLLTGTHGAVRTPRTVIDGIATGATLGSGWNFVTVNHSPTALALYIGATLAGTITASGTVPARTSFNVGRTGASPYSYSPDMNFAAIQVHNEEKSAAWRAEFISRGAPVRHAQLVSRYFSLPDATGYIIDPLNSYYAYNIDVEETWLSYGKAMLFNGTTSALYDSASGHPAFYNATGTGISCILRVDANTPLVQGVVSYGIEGSTNQRHLWFEDGYLKFKFTTSDDAQHEVAVQIELGKEYVVFATCYVDGADIEGEIWLNGVLENSVTASTIGLKNSTADLNFGMQYDSGPVNSLNGVLCDLTFYDDTIGATDIAAYYNDAQTVKTNGAYATQTITPTTQDTLGEGSAWSDAAANAWSGLPMILTKGLVGSAWEPLWIGDNADALEQVFSEVSNGGIYDIRFYSKFTDEGYTNLDDLDFDSSSTAGRVTSLDIPTNQKEVFIRTILRHKPAGTWCVAVVNFM